MTDDVVCNVDKANDEIIKKIVKSQSGKRIWMKGTIVYQQENQYTNLCKK